MLFEISKQTDDFNGFKSVTVKLFLAKNNNDGSETGNSSGAFHWP